MLSRTSFDPKSKKRIIREEEECRPGLRKHVHSLLDHIEADAMVQSFATSRKQGVILPPRTAVS